MGTDVQDLTARAKELISGRRYQEAVRACRRVLLARPDEVQVRLLLGTALLALRRYDEVRVEMLALVRRTPEQATGHRLLGEAYLRSGQPDKAREALQRASELDPSDEAIADLLAEVEGEDEVPESSTIERWFAADAMGTVETDVGELEGEATQVTTETPAPPDDEGEQSVQVDPSLGAERRPAPPPAAAPPPPAAAPPPPAPAPPPAVGRPPDKATATARVQQDTSESDVAAAHPAFDEGTEDYTVDESSEELFPADATGTGTGQAPVAGGTSQTKRARPEADEPAAPSPPAGKRAAKRTMMGGFDAPAAGDAVDEDDADPDQTAAGRPGARRGDSRPKPPPPASGGLPPAPAPRPAVPASPASGSGSPDSTSELSIEEIEEVDAAPVARNPLAGEPAPEGADAAPLEDEPTMARAAAVPADGAAEEADDELEAEPTRARPAPSPAGRSADPGAAAPPSAGPPAAGPAPAGAPSGAPPPFSGGGAAPATAAPGGQGTPSGAAGPQAAAGTPASTARRRKGPPVAVLAALALVPIALLALGGVGLWWWLGSEQDAEVRDAIRQASDDGLKSSLEEAIALHREKADDDPEDLARRARLLATGVLEHGDQPQAASELLGRLEGEEESLPNARVARAYLALARGDVDGAAEQVDGVEGEGDVAVEAARARALVAARRGELQRAVAHARSAVSARPSSPRHVALYALLTALHGDAAAALNALDGLPDGSQSPAVRIARARILQESGRDPERAVEEATAVLEQLGPRASPYHKAWAHLIRARDAAASGDTSRALSEARGAAELRPPGDERFGLSLVEIFLQAGAAADARQQLARLPEKSTQPARRALLDAEVALARGALDEAEEAVAEAEEGPRAAYVRGRIAEARDELDEARELYEEAAKDPGVRVRARTRLGAIALQKGESKRAIQLLEQAHERAPGDPELVPLFVRALLAAGETSRAKKVVRTALGRRPDAPAFHVADARVDMARGKVDEALETLRELAEQRPEDANVQATLGRAAHRAGRREEAAEAFERALEARPDHPRALLGKVWVELDAGDADAAEKAIDAAEEAGADPDSLERARARLLALEGRGLEAVDALQQVPESKRDAATWAALGWAFAQAEEDTDATSAFRRALRVDDDEAEAHLGMALVHTRAGRLGPAARSIGRAERAAKRRGLGEQYEPRILAARARHKFELGRLDAAKELAEEAVEKDADTAAAHLVLARVAIDEGQDPVPHLERALEASMPMPEVMGRLVARKAGRNPSDEMCDLAERYLEAAPHGYDAPDVRPVAARCD